MSITMALQRLFVFKTFVTLVTTIRIGFDVITNMVHDLMTLNEFATTTR